MKFPVLASALIASIALSMPADAASKKRKKVAHRPSVATVHQRAPSNSYDVYVGGELVGRDPDPAIRAYMMRTPHIWDGPD